VLVAAGGWRGEVEDVALGDAEVLEELPGGVGQVGGDGGVVPGWEVLDGVVEAGVGLAAFEEGEELGDERVDGLGHENLMLTRGWKVPGVVCRRDLAAKGRLRRCPLITRDNGAMNLGTRRFG
jgi:hypothetical protein